jgi:hypothetical protein
MLMLVPSSIGLVAAADVRKRQQHEVDWLPGLAELPVLTGEGVMQRAHRRLLVALRYCHHPQRRFGGRSRLNARPMIAARSS